MKIIKLFEEFNYHSDIDRICINYGLDNYIINSDGTVDVDGDVNLENKGLYKLPVEFNEVNGGFYCGENKLTTLEGCPKIVHGNFDCSYNRLNSLDGGPSEVDSNFYCSFNQLKSLVGCPSSVGSGCDFHCNNNILTSFEGVPDNFYVDYFNCEGNPVFQLWILFEDYKHIELFNDLDIIRDNNTIILQRLNEFLDMIGEFKVTGVKGYKCI